MTSFSYRLLLFILAFSPLAFGSVEHWSVTSVELLILLSLFLLLVGLLRSGEGLLEVPGILPLLLLVGFIAFQAIPLPASVVDFLSPASVAAYRPVLGQGEAGGWIPITVNQARTVQELIRISSYLCLYILVIQLHRDGNRVKQTVLFIVFLAGFIAFISILQKYNADNRIYWFRPSPSNLPGGPWVYRNHYAAYLAAIVPICLALFLFYRPRVRADISVRERIVTLFSSPQSSRHFYLGFIFILITVAVFINLSRGGIVVMLFSLTLFSVLGGYLKKQRQTLVLGLMGGLIIAGVSWFGWQPILDRFDGGFLPDGTIREGRLQVWQDSLELIGDYPLVGSGFGTYMDVYPGYKSLKNDLIFDHAHNDFLESLGDGGVVGFGLLGWFVLTVIFTTWNMLLRRRDNFALLVGSGCLAGLGALLLHGMLDFVFHNYTLGLYFFAICALGISVTHTRYRYEASHSVLPSLGRTRVMLLFAGVIGLSCLTGVIQGGKMLARINANKVADVYLTSHLAGEARSSVDRHLAKARFYDPFDGRYPYQQARLKGLLEGDPAALPDITMAARRQPMEGSYLQWLGILELGNDQAAGIELVLEGFRRALNKDKLALPTVDLLLHHERRQEGMDLLAERLLFGDANIDRAAPLFDLYDFSPAEIGEILPALPASWIRYANYLERNGRVAEAGFFREQALAQLENEEEILPAWFAQLINYYFRIKQPQKAIRVLRQATDTVEHAPFHVQLGDYYRAEQIWYRAAQEYKRALVLEPGNQSYLQRLKSLDQKPTSPP